MISKNGFLSKFTATLAVLVAAASSLAGPGVVGNGAGFSELYLAYAIQNYPDVISHCLQDAECSSSGSTHEALLRLHDAGARERREVKLVFVEVSKQPDTIGPHLSYKTESAQGAPIFVNSLWASLHVKSLSEATRFLMRPLLQHLQIFDGRIISEIEFQIGRLLLAHMTTAASPDPVEAPFSATVLSFARSLQSSQAPRSRLLLLDSTKALSLEKEIFSLRLCPGGTTGQEQILTNPRWTGRVGVEVDLLVDTVAHCLGKSDRRAYHGLVRISFATFSASVGPILIDPKTLRFELTQIRPE